MNDKFLLTWLVVVVAVGHDVEGGRTVVVELTRTRLGRDVVEVLTLRVVGARHAAAHGRWSVGQSRRHTGLQCRRIQSTQSSSVRSRHDILLWTSFVSRHHHQHRRHHQPQDFSQTANWCHYFMFLLLLVNERGMLPWSHSPRHASNTSDAVTAGGNSCSQSRHDDCELNCTHRLQDRYQSLLRVPRRQTALFGDIKGSERRAWACTPRPRMCPCSTMHCHIGLMHNLRGCWLVKEMAIRYSP